MVITSKPQPHAVKSVLHCGVFQFVHTEGKGVVGGNSNDNHFLWPVAATSVSGSNSAKSTWAGVVTLDTPHPTKSNMSPANRLVRSNMRLNVWPLIDLGKIPK